MNEKNNTKRPTLVTIDSSNYIGFNPLIAHEVLRRLIPSTRVFSTVVDSSGVMLLLKISDVLNKVYSDYFVSYVDHDEDDIIGMNGRTIENALKNTVEGDNSQDYSDENEEFGWSWNPPHYELNATITSADVIPESRPTNPNIMEKKPNELNARIHAFGDVEGSAGTYEYCEHDSFDVYEQDVEVTIDLTNNVVKKLNSLLKITYQFHTSIKLDVDVAREIKQLRNLKGTQTVAIVSRFEGVFNYILTLPNYKESK